MKTIKTITCVVLCVIFFPLTFIWAMCKAAKYNGSDISMIDATDKQNRLNRAEYFKKNIQ